MKVSDIMTLGVASASPDTALGDCASSLLNNRIKALPIIDLSGALKGIVSEADIIRALGKLGSPARLLTAASADRKQLLAMPAGTIMGTDVESIDGDANVEAAIDLMERRGLRHLPVTSDGKVVGMFSRADIIRALVDPDG